MRAPTLLVFCLPLSACTSTPVPIGAERCWSISSGDRVEGTAILYIPPPLSFHQGPEVSGLNCTGYSIQLVGEAANTAQAFQQMRSARRRVRVLGNWVMANLSRIESARCNFDARNES
jgi:hypothetical protein